MIMNIINLDDKMSSELCTVCLWSQSCVSQHLSAMSKTQDGGLESEVHPQTASPSPAQGPALIRGILDNRPVDYS